MEICNNADTFLINETFCSEVWDSLLCWPATKAGSSTELPCPSMKGSDSTKTVTKYCDKNGEWETFNTSNWTNYTVCFTSEILFLLKQVEPISQEDFMFRIDIAKIIRILELVGLTASLVVLMLCFIIFYYFRNLRNERTRIHIHLFLAEFGTIFMKLILYIDQIIIGYDNIKISNTGFDNTPWLCEMAYVILEYSKSSIYMWMFIEALHLHCAVAVTATRMSFKKHYLFLGWGAPLILVIIWVIVMLSKPRSHCWWGYNYNPTYWILEAPRLFILTINTIYLVNIIRQVFIKLKKNTSNEIEKMRRATKAALALLPLLGITNYISYLEPPLNCDIWYFILYGFLSYFLSSFQGSFIGSLYCLTNQEVKQTILNKMNSSSTACGNDSRLSQQQVEKKYCIDFVS